jgi:hypothetical protein
MIAGSASEDLADFRVLGFSNGGFDLTPPRRNADKPRRCFLAAGFPWGFSPISIQGKFVRNQG